MEEKLVKSILLATANAFAPPEKMGRPRTDHGLLIDTFIRVLRTGIPWRDVKHHKGPEYNGSVVVEVEKPPVRFQPRERVLDDNPLGMRPPCRRRPAAENAILDSGCMAHLSVVS